MVTLSDTRSQATDTSGSRIKQMLASAGHPLVHYQICCDEPDEFEPLLAGLLGRADVDVILSSGGTGISVRDRTIDVVEKHLDRALPGFGELFRMLSWQEIGSGAMLSRAVAGVAKGKLLFALPGSTNAVELAMSRLILPEMGHLLYEVRRQA